MGENLHLSSDAPCNNRLVNSDSTDAPSPRSNLRFLELPSKSAINASPSVGLTGLDLEPILVRAGKKKGVDSGALGGSLGLLRAFQEAI